MTGSAGGSCNEVFEQLERLLDSDGAVGDKDNRLVTRMTTREPWTPTIHPIWPLWFCIGGFEYASWCLNIAKKAISRMKLHLLGKFAPETLIKNLRKLIWLAAPMLTIDEKSFEDTGCHLIWSSYMRFNISAYLRVLLSSIYMFVTAVWMGGFCFRTF